MVSRNPFGDETAPVTDLGPGEDKAPEGEAAEDEATDYGPGDTTDFSDADEDGDDDSDDGDEADDE